MPPGRPNDLTKEVIEVLRKVLPTVLYVETVGDYLGVHRSTWRKWLNRGARERRRLDNPRNKNPDPKPKESLYLEFFDTYKRGLAEGEIYDAGVIKQAASAHWQAAAWRLERRFHKRWGRKEITDVNLDRALTQAMAALLQARQAAGPPGVPDGQRPEPGGGPESPPDPPEGGPGPPDERRGDDPRPVAGEGAPLFGA